MGLSGYEIKKIRKALKSAYPRRDKLIVMLREEIDIDESEVPQDFDYNNVLFQLIINFESQGSIKKLIDGACRGNSGNDCLQKLSTTMNAFQILAPLKEKYIQQMKQAYVDCCPEDWHINQNTETEHELEQILDNLEDMPQGKALESPIIQFVARLSENIEISENAAKKLKKWGEQNANKFSEVLTQIKNSERKRQDQQNIPNHLIVRLKPSKQHQNKRYFVSAWFIPDGGNGKFNHQTGKGYKFLENREYEQETFTLEQIPSLLEDYHNQILLDLTDPSSELTIEIFLPYELLNEPIDTWIIELEGQKIPIGSWYKVIVRSSRRLEPTYITKSWINKWKTLDKLTEKTCPVCCTSSDSDYLDKLISQLKQDDCAVTLKVMIPPSKKVFQIMDLTGIPIALWLRKELKNENLQAEVEKIMTCSITELPEQVQQKRLCDFPEKYEQRIGHHLSLLWENPYILPPQIEYTTPS